MPAIGTITFTGKSQSKYTFEIYPYNTIFNEVEAVYVVTRSFIRDQKIIYNVIYVGQTDNLKERLTNHHKEYCFNLNNANTICVLRVNLEDSRLLIESDLIEAYNPPCNG